MRRLTRLSYMPRLACFNSLVRADGNLSGEFLTAAEYGRAHHDGKLRVQEHLAAAWSVVDSAPIPWIRLRPRCLNVQPRRGPVQAIQVTGLHLGPRRFGQITSQHALNERGARKCSSRQACQTPTSSADSVLEVFSFIPLSSYPSASCRARRPGVHECFERRQCRGRYPRRAEFSSRAWLDRTAGAAVPTR